MSLAAYSASANIVLINSPAVSFEVSSYCRCRTVDICWVLEKLDSKYLRKNATDIIHSVFFTYILDFCTEIGVFLTNRFIWPWKILTLDCWNLSPRSIELSFRCCSEVQFVSMVPSTVPPSEMHPSSDSDSEVFLFPPLFSSYSFNLCHFSGAFQKSHYQAAWS